jgi:3-hydroxyacyl-CoA dehydrogenase/enoyl-CoA hydratase/3-hydroxybutyryl-CoA epimerase/enoyl-CoA isomerase
MIMQGQALTADFLSPPDAGKPDSGIVNVVFDAADSAVNTLGTPTIAELEQTIKAIQATDGVRGMIFSSAKEAFIVGADVHEFTQMFSASEEEILTYLRELNSMINGIEDLPFPTVAAINGLALGGGFELPLTCDYRIATPSAKLGLPEVKLGIHPGWGGTVRLPRLIGVDNANEWIATGSAKKASVALAEGAIDAVVADDLLLAAAVDLINKVHAGDFDNQARRVEKQSPIKLNPVEQMMAYETALGMVKGKAGPHYPAPVAAIKTMQKAANKGRDASLELEIISFTKMAKTDVSQALISIFQKDTYAKKVAKEHQKQALPVNQAAVIGAGIMGGGVAYQSASTGTPILMKDIKQEALELGLGEAQKLLAGQLKRERITTTDMGKVISAITPTLSYGDFGHVDIVIEAVVENENVKKSVLAETEKQLRDDAILTSNTSTISITELATALEKPEQFCGMHFFNPVHKMPLVEVIRGEKTSETAISTTVAFAKAMGKTPIVVNDCPGFLVNRVLFPYFGGFAQLLADGADFRNVDKVMERYGWPMGPAYLLDVVGMDTAYHADAVLAAGFPDRMAHEGENAIDRLYAKERFGQKNKLGFYRYENDKRGKLQKLLDPEIDQVLSGVVGSAMEFEDQAIIDRMMIPLCIEVARCLEENIVASAAEADLALIYGIGYPPFRGGALHYMHTIGLTAFCELADSYADLGPLYQVTDKMREMAASNTGYFDQPIH